MLFAFIHNLHHNQYHDKKGRYFFFIFINKLIFVVYDIYVQNEYKLNNYDKNIFHFNFPLVAFEYYNV